LILYFLKKWKEKHEGYPKSYNEKKDFREFVAAAARTDNPEGGEENFEEAVAAVLKTVSVPTLESSVMAVFDHQPVEVIMALP
jgi:amyloid beta precursor protein binding protein 1